ncbi:hypothetical protein BGP_3422 [Beggiatoa sp. PS]|nr:hypothetical protein BGP_3422 [Beggiatoa sp. PS]
MSIEAELGTAEAVTEGEDTSILVTVTDLDIGEIAPPVEEVVEEATVEEDKPISLDIDEQGNIVLTLRGLRIGDLVVTVTLRALTDSLEVYQVEEVTMNPEDVFASDVQGEAEEGEAEATEAVDENVEPEVVVDENAEPEVVVDENAEPEQEVATENAEPEVVVDENAEVVEDNAEEPNVAPEV